MKTERRHELKENDLLHKLEQGKEYFEKNTMQVLLYVLGIVAVIAVYNFATTSSTKGLQNTWAKLGGISNETLEDSRQAIDTLDEVISSSSNRNILMDALVNKGTIALNNITRAESIDEKIELNNRARSAFETLLNKFGSSSDVAFGSGHLGMSVCIENDFAFSSSGNPELKNDARTHLEMIKDNENMIFYPYYSTAVSKLERLDSIFQKVTFAPPALDITDSIDDITDNSFIDANVEGTNAISEETEGTS